MTCDRIGPFTPSTFFKFFDTNDFRGKNEKKLKYGQAKIRTTIIQFTAIGTRNSSEKSGTKSDQKDKK